MLNNTITKIPEILFAYIQEEVTALSFKLR